MDPKFSSNTPRKLPKLSRLFWQKFCFGNAKEDKEIFIGPESDHWQCLSLTHSLTQSRLVNLIDVTLSCEDAYSKLDEVVTIADVRDEDCAGVNKKPFTW